MTHKTKAQSTPSQWTRHLTNRRLAYLRNQLQLWKEGHRAKPPTPTNKYDYGLRKLYEEFGADRLVFLPHDPLSFRKGDIPVKKARTYFNEQKRRGWSNRSAASYTRPRKPVKFDPD